MLNADALTLILTALAGCLEGGEGGGKEVTGCVVCV